MKMIRHDNISPDIVVSGFQNLKPFIDDIVTTCFLNKCKPLVTRECYEIDSFFGNWLPKRHGSKFTHVGDESSGFHTRPCLVAEDKQVR